LVNTDEINDQGVYAVTLFKNGAKMQIILDDFFVCKNAEPIFSRAHGNELWVLLAEKAWAKSHGSYERIEWGQAHLTMRDLCGAPAFYYGIKKAEEDKMDLESKIVEWDE